MSIGSLQGKEGHPSEDPHSSQEPDHFSIPPASVTGCQSDTSKFRAQQLVHWHTFPFDPSKGSEKNSFVVAMDSLRQFDKIEHLFLILLNFH